MDDFTFGCCGPYGDGWLSALPCRGGVSECDVYECLVLTCDGVILLFHCGLVLLHAFFANNGLIVFCANVMAVFEAYSIGDLQ